MLDNVVEINGLPLEGQRQEIKRKRRHGMGFLGLGSTLAMLRMKYGSGNRSTSPKSVAREMALAGWERGWSWRGRKARRRSCSRSSRSRPECCANGRRWQSDGWKVGDTIAGRVLHARYSRYMQRVAEVAPELVKDTRANRRAFHASQFDRADRHDFAVAREQRQ